MSNEIFDPHEWADAKSQEIIASRVNSQIPAVHDRAQDALRQRDLPKIWDRLTSTAAQLVNALNSRLPTDDALTYSESPDDTLITIAKPAVGESQVQLNSSQATIHLLTIAGAMSFVATAKDSGIVLLGPENKEFSPERIALTAVSVLADTMVDKTGNKHKSDEGF